MNLNGIWRCEANRCLAFPSHSLKQKSHVSYHNIHTVHWQQIKAFSIDSNLVSIAFKVEMSYLVGFMLVGCFLFFVLNSNTVADIAARIWHLTSHILSVKTIISNGAIASACHLPLIYYIKWYMLCVLRNVITMFRAQTMCVDIFIRFSRFPL